MSILLVLHALAAVIWVGGMFFAHVVLRPSVATMEPPVRLPLWSRVLERFIIWVWVAIVVLIATGFALVQSLGGYAAVETYIHVMMGIGIVMALIFIYLYSLPWPRLQKAIGREDWNEASKNLAQIRMLVTINLVLGLLTVATAVGGDLIF
jgi:uncharacterized membrane protein